MKLSVRVKAGSKQEKVEQLPDAPAGSYIVWVRQAAHEGKANAAVIGLFSEYLGVPKSRISILRGHTSKNKILQVEE